MKIMNGLDILLLFLIGAALLAAVRKIRSDRRNGKSCLSCGGSCAGCSMYCKKRMEDNHT